MRRLLAVLAAVALGASAAPAFASHGELVLVADGPSTAVLDLPSALRIDLSGVRIETRSPYTVMAVAQRGEPTAYALSLPGAGEWVLRSGDRVPAGRSVVRVVTQGRTTVRLPMLNMRGHRTIRMSRLAGSAAVLRTLTPGPDNDVVDDIGFAMRGRAMTVHAVERPHEREVAWADSACVTRAESACRAALPHVWPDSANGDRLSIMTWSHHGQAHAYYESRSASIGPRPVTHLLVSLPLE